MFSIPMSGNFPELKLSAKPSFLSHQQIMSAMLTAGWEVVANNKKSIQVKFINQLEALRAVKAVGANYNKTICRPAKGLLPIKLDKIFINPDINQLTYKVGIYLARKVL